MYWLSCAAYPVQNEIIHKPCYLDRRTLRLREELCFHMPLATARALWQ
uniref:Uncharacterized protein n=1 Tax=Anguilla anguilla TaxID=7936 RepID=A0A0E9Q6I6_ANGAN